jgi:biotin operon repressor
MAENEATPTETPAEATGNVSQDKFLTEVYAKDEQGNFIHTSAQTIADKLGMNKPTVTSRMSKLRSEGYDIREFKRGGGVRINHDASLKLLAELSGRTLEEVKAAGEKRKADAAKRKAEKASN